MKLVRDLTTRHQGALLPTSWSAESRMVKSRGVRMEWAVATEAAQHKLGSSNGPMSCCPREQLRAVDCVFSLNAGNNWLEARQKAPNMGKAATDGPWTHQAQASNQLTNKAMKAAGRDWRHCPGGGLADWAHQTCCLHPLLCQGLGGLCQGPQGR